MSNKSDSFELKVQIYKGQLNPGTQVFTYQDFGSAVKTAEVIASVMNTAMPLSRHITVDGPFGHMGYYADLYNEISITVKEKTKP